MSVVQDGVSVEKPSDRDPEPIDGGCYQFYWRRGLTNLVENGKHHLQLVQIEDIFCSSIEHKVFVEFGVTRLNLSESSTDKPKSKAGLFKLFPNGNNEAGSDQTADDEAGSDEVVRSQSNKHIATSM
ncbi:MAG: hypothetical protein AAFN77_19875 [Planctomycetota bacterium]